MRTNLSQILILLEMREETLCSSDNADVARRPKLLIEYKTYASAGSNGVDDIYVREIGKKRYELSDHLGNVRVVVKDLKNAVLKSAIKKDNFDTGVSNWLAANNYNSLLIENKKLKVSYEGTATTGTGAYFTASVTSGKTYVWKFDLEIGTAPSIRYYATMGSNYMGLKHVNEGGSYTVRFTATTTGTVTLKTEASAAGNYQYSVDNSIFAEEGNFEPEIISAETYYPFGMPMPGRTYNNDQYRFGFNGKENDNEVKGTGNQQDYGFRIYDPRLGRFLSIDPLTAKFPMLTPYQFGSNNPIQNIDLDGLEGLSFQMFKAAGITMASAQQIQYDIEHRALPVAKDVAIIGGGLLSMVASGGATTPLVMGAIGTLGGGAKFYYDFRGEHKKSESIPTTISGTVMVTANYMVGEEAFIQSFRANVEFAEGLLTLDLKNFKNLPDVKKASEFTNVINLSIDATSVPENLKDALSNITLIPTGKLPTTTAVDNTGVAPPIKTEVIAQPTTSNKP